MNNLKQLSNKEKKLLFKKIEINYGVNNLKLDYMFFKSNEGKIFIVNSLFRYLDKENLNINSVGLYFCRVEKELRLTIEGSQIIGPFASKNILELDDIDADLWLKGDDIKYINDKSESTFVILKNKNDYIGTGKYKDGKILNYIPKERRIK